MESLASFAVLSFGSLFAVLNPFATVPPFLSMTGHNSPAEQRAMALKACGIAAGVLVVFAVSGLRVPTFFGVTVPAFQIAGGLVLIRVAFELLQGGQRLKVTREEQLEGEQKDDISITPLAVPILTLQLATRYLHRLGETPIKISSRLMGLILVAVAVQFVVNGVQEARLAGA